MRDERQYLHDIAEASELIDELIREKTYEMFLADKALQSAILFNFTIIGEASNKISPEVKRDYPEIDWSSIIGFRNLIVHAYFSLDMEAVFKAATRRVLPLAEQVRAIIRHDFEDERTGSQVEGS
jgi:uncharacterized protein with HEPN domain